MSNPVNQILNKEEFFNLKNLTITHETEIALITNELKHLTQNVHELGEKISEMTKIISHQSGQLLLINEQNERQKKIWKTIKNQWWRIAAFGMGIGAVLIRMFDIVWQIPHK